MRPDYLDILERVPEPPKWWDWHGVPRYRPFKPRLGGAEACLLLIECQWCERPFTVEFLDTKISDLIIKGTVDYGDPPNVGCCRGGAATSSVAKRVLEFWRCFEPEYDVGVLHERLTGDVAKLEALCGTSSDWPQWAPAMIDELRVIIARLGPELENWRATRAEESEETRMRRSLGLIRRATIPWTRDPLLEVPVSPRWLA